MATLLENIVIDAENPRALGAFWAQALGGDIVIDSDEDTTISLGTPTGGPLDVCLVRVSSPTRGHQRLHLDLAGGDRQAEIVETLLGLGATHLDIGQRDTPWVVLADPEGNAFCVMESRERYRDTGPIAALPLDARDPAMAADFWIAATGWVLDDSDRPFSLRHPSATGPLLELSPEPDGKTAKLPIHLDVRVSPDSSLDAEVARLTRPARPSWSTTGARCRGSCWPTRPATSSAYCHPTDSRPATHP